LFVFFFFFNDTATTEIYTLSLHDALPISQYEPPDDQLQVIRLMEAIYKAGEEGKEVRL